MNKTLKYFLIGLCVVAIAQAIKHLFL